MKIKILIPLLVGALFITGCGEDTDKDKDKTDKYTDGFGETRETGELSESGTPLKSRVVYGEDNRLDLYEVANEDVRVLASSTVALMSVYDLQNKNDGTTKIKSKSFAEAYRLPLCPDERFREQRVAAYCTGFLIGKNRIATAGHCIRTEGQPNSDCTLTKFVFGYQYAQADQNPDIVPTNNIYSCKRIIKSQVVYNGADFAIVELDRDVIGYTPLQIRRNGSPQVGDELVVLGHPSGLPLKIAGGANVRSLANGYLQANLDTYGGNSGSAVISAATGEVEGILVRGETDYEEKNNCLSTKVCDNNGCRGEDVTLTREFLPFVD